MTERTPPERLRDLAADARNSRGDTMKHWDEIRHQVETRKGSDLPRLNFESLIETFSEALDEAADALDAKSALLAETVETLGDGVAALERVHSMTPGGRTRSEIVGKLHNARALLAKIKAANAKPAPQPEGHGAG